MTQWLQVLRGCFAAYGAGVLVIGGYNALSSGGLAVTGFVALFGLLVMIPFSIVALVIWAVLAGRNQRVSMFGGITICAGVFAVFGMIFSTLEGSFTTILFAVAGSLLIGAAFGAAFWLGAFGFERQVVLKRDET